MNEELMQRARELLALRDKATPVDGAVFREYDHGGGRLFVEAPQRRLILDVYHEGDRSFFFSAHKMADTIAELLAEVERLTPDRRALQEAGEHPAPCARHCESTAYEIELRQLRSRAEAAEAKLSEFEGVAPVAWMTDRRSVCGEGLTRDLKLAECWAADGWSVTSLIPIPEMPS